MTSATLFDHRSADVLLDEPPDTVGNGGEFGTALQRQRTWARQVDGDDLLYAPGAPAEDEDAIGEIDRLVDLVGNECSGDLAWRGKIDAPDLHPLKQGYADTVRGGTR